MPHNWNDFEEWRGPLGDRFTQSLYRLTNESECNHESDRLGKMIDLIGDEKETWSKRKNVQAYLSTISTRRLLMLASQ